MKKYFSAVFAAFILFVGIFSSFGCNKTQDPGSVTKESPCGEGLTWSFDHGKNTLLIKGDGAMADFTPDGETDFVPWRSLNVENVVFEGNITKIGAYAFYNLKNISSVKVPSTVKDIGDHAFSGCAIKEIDLADAENIGEFAFAACIRISSLFIPKSVKTIKASSFSGCCGLAKITVDPENSVYYSEKNSLLEKEGKILVLGCVNSVLPDDTKAIGDHAFAGCYALHDIAIPNSVKNIGDYAFSGCSGLKDIYIPSDVENIGEHAFSGCNGFVDLEINGNVKNIGAHAFESCENLNSISLTSGIKVINEYVFNKCVRLKAVTFYGDIEKIAPGAFLDCNSLKTIIYHGSPDMKDKVVIADGGNSAVKKAEWKYVVIDE